jgi:hypothetical protein
MPRLSPAPLQDFRKAMSELFALRAEVAKFEKSAVRDVKNQQRANHADTAAHVGKRANPTGLQAATR